MDSEMENSSIMNNDNESEQLSSWRKKKELRQKERQQQQSMNGDDHFIISDTSTAPTTTYNMKKRQREQLEQEILLSKKKSSTIRARNSFNDDENDNDDNDIDIDDNRRPNGTSTGTVSTNNATSTTTATMNANNSDDSTNLPSEKAKDDQEGGSDGANVISLLDRVAKLHQQMTIEERNQLAMKEEEERILREATKVSHNALLGANEIAHDTKYTKPMYSTWTIPSYMLRNENEEIWNKVRDEWHMHVQGNDIPPPMKRFQDMKLPKPILHYLQNVKKIIKPTPIQIQGLPVALSGRDMIGIAFTGSGKTLTFSLPLVMLALEDELRMPIIAHEGPIGIILAPSRELARQTYELVTELCNALQTYNSDSTYTYPIIRTQLMIGGESVRDQIEVVRTHGVHCIVATPGRLRDVLKRRNINLLNCRYICLDEADRMLDMGFDEEVGEIMNYFTNQRQTLLFSATFPKKFQDFAQQTLVQPIIVNVGRAGAANLDVIQEVEYVKEEAKIVYLLHCLLKTAPPVIIFCERTSSVDDIYEYLLLKGVESVSIHGGKDQEERNEAIQLFKAGQKDVLIATDIAAKGLDFPAIQHVINFDMPNEIENYVHPIGRTGRAGKTGVATTFINKSCDETTLLDLKALLQEAKQRIPPVLMMLDDPREHNKDPNQTQQQQQGGCSFCGGLGHTIVDCPKIDKDARRVAGSHRDVLASGGGGGDW